MTNNEGLLLCYQEAPSSTVFAPLLDVKPLVCLASAKLIDLKFMRLDELDYHLPQAQIAQRPAVRRDASRLLLLDRKSGAWEDRSFADFPALLRGDELLVANNARVIPARLFGRRLLHSEAASPRSEASGAVRGQVEVFLCRQREPGVWEAMVRPGR